MSKGNGKSKSAGEIHVSLLDPTGGHMDDDPVLPGWYGLPFKGEPPNLKAGDPQHMQPETGMKVHVEILDLSKPEDMSQYQKICQLVGNGVAQISKEDMRYDEQKKHWRVFMRWLELFTYDPTKGKGHGFPR